MAAPAKACSNSNLDAGNVLMRFLVYGITDTGCVRSKNEDRILVGGAVCGGGEARAEQEAPMLAAVCDGVGGERGGERAAQLCLEELSKIKYSSLTDLKQTVAAIHGRVLEAAMATKEHRNMQTTLCALALDEKSNGLCVNVGDSRLYRYAGGAATLLSTDQTLVRYLYDMGEITAQEMKTSPDRNVILSSIGGERQPPIISVTPLGEPFGSLADDTVILCTDGVSDYLGRTEIEVCMGLDADFEDKIDAIYRLALSRGSCDNLSIVGITCVSGCANSSM